MSPARMPSPPEYVGMAGLSAISMEKYATLESFSDVIDRLDSTVRRPRQCGYAALSQCGIGARMWLRRSSISWHRMQFDAQGIASSRLEAIASPHSAQVP